MAKCKVLRAFPYGGAEGTRASTVELKVGDEHEIIDQYVPGLEREGYVKRVVAEEPAVESEAPAPDKASPSKGSRKAKQAD